MYLTVLKQLLIMLVISLLAFLFSRKNRFGSSESAFLSRILLYFVNPCLIFSSFNRAFDMQKLQELAFVILVGTVAGYFLYYASMKYISAYLASMTFLLKPIFACLMACCLAGEKMNAWTITGTVVIVCSLLVTSLPAHKRSNG